MEKNAQVGFFFILSKIQFTQKLLRLPRQRHSPLSSRRRYTSPWRGRSQVRGERLTNYCPLCDDLLSFSASMGFLLVPIHCRLYRSCKRCKMILLILHRTCPSKLVILLDHFDTYIVVFVSKPDKILLFCYWIC